MDSYYALGATSVPMRKSRLVTAIRFSMCLHYNRSWKRKQATQPKHFHIFSTNSKFSQSFTISYYFFTTHSFPPFSLYTFPPSEKNEAVKGSRKKYCSQITEKRADLKDSYLSIRSALWIFSDTFSPLTGAVFSDRICSNLFVWEILSVVVWKLRTFCATLSIEKTK